MKGDASGFSYQTFTGSPHASLTLSFVASPSLKSLRGAAPLSPSRLRPDNTDGDEGEEALRASGLSDFRLSGDPR